MPLFKSLGDGLFELRFTLAPLSGGSRTGSPRTVASSCSRLRRAVPLKETAMANYSRWEDVKKKRSGPDAETRAGVEQDLALGQLIYDLRTEAGLSQRELAERMGTTQSVISRLEEGGGARNRIDTLARVATALGRHLVVSFPEKVPAKLKDAVQVA
jgi:ribosome-binding protein aMBF1 (putative translation factor)